MAENHTPRESCHEVRAIQPNPSLLDVLQVDGRWAQIYAIGSHGNFSIRFLDTQQGAEIILNEYDITHLLQRPIFSVQDEVKIPDEEVQNVIWGPEQNAHPHLQRHVCVFGVCIRKTIEGKEWTPNAIHSDRATKF